MAFCEVISNSGWRWIVSLFFFFGSCDRQNEPKHAKLFTKRSRSAGFQTVWVVDKKAKLWVGVLSISFVVLEMESGSSLDLVQI